MSDCGKDEDQELGQNGQRLVPIGATSGSASRYDRNVPVSFAPQAEERDSLASSVMYYVQIFFKRKWLILGSLLLIVSVGMLKALMMTPRYSAAVRIQIDREPVKIVEHGSTTPQEEGGIDFLKTQFELLKSRGMAERVVTSLELSQNADFVRAASSPLAVFRTLFKTNEQVEEVPLAKLQNQAIKIVSSNVDIRPVPNSRLVDITYMDTSAIRTQKIANAYADAYVSSTVDRRFQANAYAKTFLEDQIKQLKIRLEESEKVALTFAEREKIVDVNDKAPVAESNLEAANAALGRLISDRIKNEQLWRQVESAPAINLPQFLTNKVIDELRGQRKTLETEYQEKLENFKPGYPAMVQISSKIKEINRQLSSEIKTIRSSLKAAYDAALNEENEMKNRIEQLKEEVLDLQKKKIRYNTLKREADTNRNLYNSLLQRFKEVDIAGGTGANNVFIVDRAVTPDSPTEPNFIRAFLFCFVLGLAAGSCAAYLLEIFDDRVRAPEELEQLAGFTTFGIIPRVPEKLLESALDDPRSVLGEAHRSLATALQFSTETGLPQSIAITSAGPGEGKSTTAIAIARYFASLGLRVLLVDADLRRPTLHTKLKLKNSSGLSNFLAGTAVPAQVVQGTGYTNLSFMGSGPLPPNAVDLLGSNRVLSLVSQGSEFFNLIIIDCPPMMGLADAQLLTSAAAMTVFVVGAGQYRKGIIRSALRRLHGARIEFAGLVLTKFDARAAGYGYGYYAYGSSPYAYGKSIAGQAANRELSKPVEH